MASRFRATVTIGGNKFDAISVTFAVTTMKDRAGIPEMGTLTTGITVYADMDDTVNLSPGTLMQLFSLANIVTRDKVKAIKIEYWKDESKTDALCVYSFQGWISHFRTSHPIANLTDGLEEDTPAVYKNINHLLTLQLEPVITGQNTQDITMSN